MAFGSLSANAQSFALTGSLTTARYDHTATLLNNGMVLIAGGVGSNAGSLADAELYNPATGTFAPTGSLTTARAWHTATLLSNGMVLIAGGCAGCPPGSNGTPLADTELYNPATGAFTSSGSLNTARTYHTATALANGMVLFVGGCTGPNCTGGVVAAAELYDPATGTVTVTGSLQNARYFHATTLLNDGTALITGGQNCGGCVLATAEIYNPQTGVFTLTTNNMISGRTSRTAPLLNSGKVLISGGSGSSGYLASAELYDPLTGTFTSTGSLNTPHAYQTATLLNNGMVLIAGGYNNSSYLVNAELYDPASGSFTSTGSLNTARYVHTATLLNNGMVLIAGGLGSSGSLASAELYNPPLDNDSQFSQLNGGNTFTGNQNVNGNVNATTFVGNGSGLTGVITGVTAGAGLTGGGTGGNIGLSLASATCGAGSAVTAHPFTCTAFPTFGANTFTGNQSMPNLVVTNFLSATDGAFNGNIYGNSVLTVNNNNTTSPSGSTGIQGYGAYYGVIGNSGTAGIGLYGQGGTGVWAQGNPGIGLRADTYSASSAVAAAVLNNYGPANSGNILLGKYNGTTQFSVDAKGDVAASGSVTIGTSIGGTPIPGYISRAISVTVAGGISPSNCATLPTINFPGASDGDTVALGVPNALVVGGAAGNLEYFAWVSAANTVSIRVCNTKPSGGSNSTVSGTIHVDIWKH
jgi:hypothetical protein